MNVRKEVQELAVPVATPTDQVVPLYERTLEEIRQRACEIYIQR